MDRQTLVDAINSGPIKVTMNDGSAYVIPSAEFAIVDSMAAHVLTKAEDGETESENPVTGVYGVDRKAGNSRLVLTESPWAKPS